MKLILKECSSIFLIKLKSGIEWGGFEINIKLIGIVNSVEDRNNTQNDLSKLHKWIEVAELNRKGCSQRKQKSAAQI